MRVGIINCKKSKQNYECCAFEMYSKSSMFRSMAKFCETYYDEYYILSAQYGLLSPSDIIKPYNKVMGKMQGYAKKDAPPVLEGDELDMWVDMVMAHPIWDSADIIETHVGSAYLNPLKPHLPTNVVVHSLPKNTGYCTSHYNFLNEQIAKGDYSVDLTIDYDRINPMNRPFRMWYHPEYAPTGVMTNPWNIHNTYSNTKVSINSLNNVERNNIIQHKNWQIQPLN